MNMRRLRCLARSQTLASSELFGSVAAMASCGYCPSDLVTIRISTMLMTMQNPKRLQPVVAVVLGDLLAFMIAGFLQIFLCVCV